MAIDYSIPVDIVPKMMKAPNSKVDFIYLLFSIKMLTCTKRKRTMICL